MTSHFLTWRHHHHHHHHHHHFFNVTVFLLSILVADAIFMSISSLVPELWKFSFKTNWPEIWKSEIPPPEFCPISGDWGELLTRNLEWMFLKEWSWTLQNTRVTAFTVSGLWRENQQWKREENYPPIPTQIRVKMLRSNINELIDFFDDL